MWVVGYEMWEQQPGSSKIRHRRKILKPVSIRKLLPVILSEAKNLCGPINYEILRRPPEAGLLRMTPKATVFGSRQAKELTP
jgi:hypothetical protein